MIEIPDPESSERVADWIELNLATGEKQFSKAIVSSIVEGASGQETSEAFLSSVWRILDYREDLYARKFFKVEDRTISTQLNNALPAPNEYLICLFLSLFGVQGNTQAPSKLFERLTREAVENYLTGKAIVFGWPFEKVNGDEETAIKLNVMNVANKLNEKFYETPASRFKDRGLDVIGWIPFEDGRSGQSVILIQCAAGHNWTGKLPVPIDAWSQYIHWACNPIKAFAVPCVVDEREWHESSTDKGILFDRIRLMNLLQSGIKEKDLNKEINAWVKSQLADYT